jgi:hypothetical protein
MIFPGAVLLSVFMANPGVAGFSISCFFDQILKKAGDVVSGLFLLRSGNE